MTNEAKISKIQTNFKALSELATSLNTASDNLTKTVALLDEALKKLNIGLTVWVMFRDRGIDEPHYSLDQIGYTKVSGVWGIALRHIWGSDEHDDFHEEGPWLFNDASREMRLHSVDKLPELIEELATEALEIKNKIDEKTHEVLGLAAAITPVVNESKGVKSTSFQISQTMPISGLGGSIGRVSVLAGPVKPVAKSTPPPPPSSGKAATRPAPAPFAPPTRNTEGNK